MEGGFLCGTLTLLGDLAKGFLPVFCCVWTTSRLGIYMTAGLALVMTAPVIGHAFPVYHRFQGGKGIAVSFGSLLGLFPDLRPALVLAAFFYSVFPCDPDQPALLQNNIDICLYNALSAGFGEKSCL